MNASHWGVIARNLTERNIPFLPITGKLLLSVKAMAVLLAVSESSVLKWLKMSGCPVIRPGQMILIDPDEFTKWFNRSADHEEGDEEEKH